MSKDFAFGLFDLDWDVFSAHVDGAVHRVPVIGETGVKSTVCGPGTVITGCFTNQMTDQPNDILTPLFSRIVHSRSQTSDGRGSRMSRLLSRMWVQLCWHYDVRGVWERVSSVDCSWSSHPGYVWL